MFLIKNFNYFTYPQANIGRPSYRRSLQPSIHENSSLFLLLWAIFSLLDPDPEPSYQSGSTRIRIRNTASNLIFLSKKGVCIIVYSSIRLCCHLFQVCFFKQMLYIESIREDSCDNVRSTVQDRQILVDQGNNEILDITINNGFPPLPPHIYWTLYRLCIVLNRQPFVERQKLWKVKMAWLCISEISDKLTPSKKKL